MTQQEIIQQLKSLAANDPELVVMWLYGSRARNTAQPKSDYDLAVAFDKP
jgi:predicted nucleotidyltransferase